MAVHMGSYPKTKRLTELQMSVYLFIRDFRDENGFPPTLREICDHFEWASSMSAFQHLVSLEKKGALLRADATARGLKLLPLDSSKIPHGQSEEGASL